MNTYDVFLSSFQKLKIKIKDTIVVIKAQIII